MTVPSHLRAGLEFQRRVSLAEAMSEPDDERRAELMRRVSVPLEEGE
jgi:hypothetical protein